MPGTDNKESNNDAATNEAELLALKQQRANIKRNITTIKVKVEKEGTKVDATILECRLQIMESYFKELNHIQSQIEKLNPADTARSDLEELFIAAKAKLVSFLNTKRRGSTIEASFLNSSNMGLAHSSRLPSLKLPRFDGKFAQYKRFISSFSHMVNNDSTISAIDKFNYLLSCLSGPALAVVEPFQVTEENYPKALTRLKERYDNDVLIFLDHITELFNIPSMKSADANVLRNIIDTVSALRGSLLSLGSEQEVMNCILIHIVLSKVDPDTKMSYDEKQDYVKLPSWDDCYQILSRRCQFLMSRGYDVDKYDRHRDAKNKQKPLSKVSSKTFLNSKAMCNYCNSADHLIGNCPTFISLPVSQRFDFVKRSGLCINCLRKGHSVTKCQSQSRCRVCRVSHHTHLHIFSSSTQKDSSLDPNNLTPVVPNADQQQPSYSGQQTQLTPQTSSFSFITRSSRRAIIPTALILIRDKYGNMQPVRALLDSCSELNFMTEEIAKRLQLEKHHVNHEVSGISDIKTQIKYKVFSSIQSRVTNFKWALEFSVIKSISSQQPCEFINKLSWKIPPHIELANPLFHKPTKVDLLISSEIFFELLLNEKLSLGEGMPYLVNTELGWVVGGKLDQTSNAQRFQCNLIKDILPLETIVQRFWEIEDYKEKSTMRSEQDMLCEHHFIDNVSILPNGRIQVGLPFIKGSEALGDSFNMARKRFISLERKLQRDEVLQRMYVDFMDEYLALGHMSPIDPFDHCKPHYYIPHHAVLRPQSITTKLRVVFDASAQTSSNRSLNDILMVGPTIQQDLITTLLTFRLHKFALTADISKMYRQFLIRDEDKWFQLILWRSDPNKPLQAYQLQTITYGMSAAPFLAIRSLFHIADTYCQIFPCGAEVLRNDLYVDDVLTGSDTLEELKQKKFEVTEILKKACLHLAKWNSNSREIVFEGDSETRFKTNDDIAKALGMSWKPERDIFCFRFDLPEIQFASKRSILSVVAKIFDLLGILSPVIIRCKILIQEMWIKNLSWDEPLPNDLKSLWCKIKDDLPGINNIEVPRFVFTSSLSSSELHGFSDASQRAYGCCIYVRTRINDTYKVTLLIAKSKVAPIKAQSLPRLELCAALLLCRTWRKLHHKIKHLISSIYFWTDSRIVLQWMKMHSSQLNCFVGNRVSEIQEETKDVVWKHVPTKSNPADIVSRGCSAVELPNSIWFTGPAFLSCESNKWPNNQEEINIDMPAEFRKMVVFKCNNSGNEGSLILNIINNNSSYYRTLRIVSYVFRVFNGVAVNRSLQPANIKHLSSKELNKTFWRIVAEIQASSFLEEIRILKGHKILKSSIQKLSPFIHNMEIDDKVVSLIRVGGRLSKAPIPFDAKFPALIPKNHRFTYLYTEFLHRLHLHAGPKVLIALLREKVWVINARDVVRKVVRQCTHCFHYKPKLMQQIMGSLPADRLKAQRPFLVTGVDFCGPFLTSLNIRGRVPYKTYAAIFVCFASKAVHTELVTELSTNAFLLCLKRFIARRGVPQRIFCDNATNFVGAQSKLANFQQTFFSDNSISSILSYCTKTGFEFCFIPPRAPHFGGLWEAAVKSTKTLLYKNISQAILTYEELQTVFIEVEAILNSRPIVQMSDDPNDGEALTPAHLLIGSTLMAAPDEHISDAKISYLSRWQRVTYLKQRFWELWVRDYVLQLQQKAKWFSDKPNIETGQLVIVHEDNTPPQQWLLARVSAAIPGADGKVRVVDLRTKKGFLRRPIHKIAPLPRLEEF